MTYPDTIKYHVEHTWIRLDGAYGYIGITDFAQHSLGEIVYVDLPDVGASFDKDEIFGSVEALKTVSDLYMPVSGQILEVNTSLHKSPALVNEEPFDGGWIAKIAVKNPEELDVLLGPEDYKNKIDVS